MDRVLGFEPIGCTFESCQAGQTLKGDYVSCNCRGGPSCCFKINHPAFDSDDYAVVINPLANQIARDALDKAKAARKKKKNIK